MIRILALAAAFAVIAGSTSAQEIHVKIDGKDDATLQHEIRLAAHRMCGSYTSGRRGLEPQMTCVTYAVRDAQDQIARARAVAQGASSRLASTK